MILRISRGTRRTFSTQEVRRKMIFPHYLRSLHDVLMNGKVMFQSSKKEKQKGDIFFSMKYHLYWLLKGPCFELLWDGKYGLFWAKKVAEIWYLLITEKFLFWTFREREMRPFLRQKVDEKLVFTDYRKVLVLNFYVMGNTVFFETKRWWKDYIYWLLKIFCFCYQNVLVLNISVMGNTVFLSQRFDAKVISTLAFWTVHDIPRPGKYGFSCSVNFLALAFW